MLRVYNSEMQDRGASWAGSADAGSWSGSLPGWGDVGIWSETSDRTRGVTLLGRDLAVRHFLMCRVTRKAKAQ